MTHSFLAFGLFPGSKCGMSFARPLLKDLPDDRADTYVRALRELIDPSVDLVMPFMLAQKGDRYSAVKRLCCVDQPVASQARSE